MAFLDNDVAGGIELTTIGTAPVYDANDKKFGSTSAYFSGAGSFRSTTQVPWSFPSSFTLHFWIKTSDQGFDLISHGTSAQGRNWDLRIVTNSVQFRKAGGAGLVYWTGDFYNNTWRHVAIVKSGTTWRIFVDGDLKATRTDSWTPDTASFHIEIGNYYDGSDHYLTGRLDSLCWQNQALWTSNFTPPTSPPIADGNTRMLFQFNETFYQVQGALSDEARVTVIDYDSRIVEYDAVKSAGAYAIDVADNSVKLIVAERISDGTALAYGQVIPVEA